MDELVNITDKAKLFVQAYVGEAQFNATKAAKIAGYKHPHSVGAALKKKHLQAIQEAMVGAKPEQVMGSKESLEILAEIARNPEHKDRLRAVELSLKVHGLLSDKLNLNIKREDLNAQLIEIAQSLISASDSQPS